MTVPQRKPLSRKAKIAIGVSGTAGAVLVGVGLGLLTLLARRDRGVPPPQAVEQVGPVSQARDDVEDPEAAVTEPADEGTSPPVARPPVEAANVSTGKGKRVAMVQDTGTGREPDGAKPDPEPPPEPEQVPDPRPPPKPVPGQDDAAVPVKPPAQPVTPPTPAVPPAGLLAYEGFDYPKGILAGRDGGVGWMGAWSKVDRHEGRVMPRSLVPSPPTAVVLERGGGLGRQPRDSRNGRSLDTSPDGVFDRAGYLDGKGDIGADGKTLYVSFLQRPSNTVKFWEFEFHRDDLKDRGRISGIGNDYNGHDVRLRGPRTPKIGRASTNASFYVVRIDFKPGKDAVRVFRNPPLTGEPPADEAAVNVRGFRDMSFDGVSLGAFGNKVIVDHDEIRIGGTYASVVPVGNYVPGGVADAILRRDFKGAVQGLARCYQKHSQLDVLGEIERKLTDVDATVLRSFENDVGKQVSIQLAAGSKRALRIERVEGGRITCTLEDGKKRVTKDLRLEDLHLQERLYRLGGSDSAVAWVQHGLLAVANGQPAVARESFAKLGEGIGEALAARMDKVLLETAREGIAELLRKAGVAADAGRLDNALREVVRDPPPAMVRLRLLGALKRYRSDLERRIEMPDECRTILAKFEEVLGASGAYGTAGNPVAHWMCDELSGRAVNDKQGVHNGTTYGGVTRRDGKSKGCLRFDGEGRVVVSRLGALTPKRALTWTAWIKTGREGTIMACTVRDGGWPQNGRNFLVRGEKLTFDVGSVGTIGGKAVVADGKWHHVAVTVTDGTAVRLYVDGKPDNDGKLPRDPGRLPGGCVLKLGFANDNYNPGGFTGLIDDVMCYDRALTPEQVKALYERLK